MVAGRHRPLRVSGHTAELAGGRGGDGCRVRRPGHADGLLGPSAGAEGQALDRVARHRAVRSAGRRAGPRAHPLLLRRAAAADQHPGHPGGGLCGPDAAVHVPAARERPGGGGRADPDRGGPEPGGGRVADARPRHRAEHPARRRQREPAGVLDRVRRVHAGEPLGRDPIQDVPHLPRGVHPLRCPTGERPGGDQLPRRLAGVGRHHLAGWPRRAGRGRLWPPAKAADREKGGARRRSESQTERRVRGHPPPRESRTRGRSDDTHTLPTQHTRTCRDDRMGGGAAGRVPNPCKP